MDLGLGGKTGKGENYMLSLDIKPDSFGFLHCHFPGGPSICLFACYYTHVGSLVGNFFPLKGNKGRGRATCGPAKWNLQAKSCQTANKSHLLHIQLKARHWTQVGLWGDAMKSYPLHGREIYHSKRVAV